MAAANAQVTAFRAALGRIGFNAPMRVAINENGLQTIIDLVKVQDEDLDKLNEHLKGWRDPVAGPNAQVWIPFVSLIKLKVMRYWVISQHCIGVQAPQAQDFTDAVLNETLTRIQADKDFKRATEDAEIQKPEKLADINKWTKFWELFTTYLGRVKGAAMIPLSYLMREHEEVSYTGNPSC
jgi:hypothetical protein